MTSTIEALRATLATQNPPVVPDVRPTQTDGVAYPVWRLLLAWRHALESGRRLGPDHAVLLRQVVRWHGDEVYIGDLTPEFIQFTSRAGLDLTDTGFLRALPFLPSWLTDPTVNPSEGIDPPPERRRPVESVPGEAFLASVGFRDWHSRAQKEAVWLALTAPPRSTTLVGLPTGAGKSLCFQMLARYGSGLTVVVVPTVALALDHWRSAQRVLGGIEGLNPEYFAAADPDRDPAQVAARVRSGETRLVFTSPEACVSGRLRHALAERASRGSLDTLVVDEAHLVDTWGMYFRADFQVLSVLRRQWLENPEARVRTVLLSATFTPGCRELLRALFCEPATVWREFISQRLRPEMTYYFRRFATEPQRKEAVVECAWHLPRPAIIYTTKRSDAVSLTRTLFEEGFERIGCFHGETPSSKRRELLDQWRNDRIDLMVATSAFGLGVDKPDVRSVVHACFPEDLHRYYQEVGRGGRDGSASICVLLPTPRDEEVAASLAPNLLRPETIQRRWEALWGTARPVTPGDHTWAVRLDAKPLDLAAERTGMQHIDWNRRLLLQLLRAGRIELRNVALLSEEGIELEPGAQVGSVEWATVRVNFPPGSAAVGTLVQEVRSQEMDSISAGLRYMREYLAGTHCIGTTLRALYGETTVRACGGCPACRRIYRRITCPPLPISSQALTEPELSVVAEIPDPRQPVAQPAFIAFVRRLLRERRIRRFACSMALHRILIDLFARAVRPDDPRLYYRIDPIDTEPAFVLHPDEVIAFLHVGCLTRQGLSFRGGSSVVHLVTTGTPYLDSSERRPLEREGAAFFPTPETWLQES